MDFRFTEDQQDLIDAAKAFFDGENAVERMRVMAAGETVTNLLPTLLEFGLVGVMVPQENNGLGQNLVVMTGIAEAAGYSGLPEPLVEMAGITIPLLYENHIEYDEAARTLDRIFEEKQWVGLNASMNAMNFANHACEIVETTEYGIVVLPSPKADIIEQHSIDPLREVNISKVRDRGVPNKLADYHGAILTAAQLIGLSQRMVDMSVDYAKDRHQFGKAIGSFQAVKHLLANVYTQIEFTRPIIHLAAIKGGAAVHNAKVAAIDTAMLAAETAIQVHGGMGYTYEVDLHLFMKRAWALCGEWGDRNYHMKKLEEYILDGDAELGPGQTFK